MYSLVMTERPKIKIKEHQVFNNTEDRLICQITVLPIFAKKLSVMSVTTDSKLASNKPTTKEIFKKVKKLYSQ